MDKNELTYTNDKGETVYTSAYLKKRGTCCKTNCLHCPYDFTIKNYSIEILEMEHKHIKFANEIISDSKPEELSDFTKMMLGNAFGNNDKVKSHHITEDNLQDFAFGTFKEEVCAVIEFSKKLSESSSGRSIKEIFLKKEFQDQGLGPEHITL